MRTIALFAIALLVLAGLAAQYVGKLDPDRKQLANAQVLAANANPIARRDRTDNSRTVTVRRDRRGHYQVEATVNGRRIGLMVDTGASVVALSRQEAERLGIFPATRDYRAPVQTANGVVRAAPVQLSSLEIGGITVRDVSALVVPDDALAENLLGLSFLSRLRRYEFAEGRLVLEQ